MLKWVMPLNNITYLIGKKTNYGKSIMIQFFRLRHLKNFIITGLRFLKIKLTRNFQMIQLNMFKITSKRMRRRRKRMIKSSRNNKTKETDS